MSEAEPSTADPLPSSASSSSPNPGEAIATGSGCEGNDGASAAVKDESEGEFRFEQLILTIREVFVYKIPPLRSSSGYRAEEWDLANPMLTGVLRLYQQDTEMFLRLYEPKRDQEDVLSLGLASMELELFAECPIRPDPEKGRTLQIFVESVVDSSRYFVLRCEDRTSKRHAFIGIGFRDRQHAFDLKASLQDFVRYVERTRMLEQHPRRTHIDPSRSAETPSKADSEEPSALSDAGAAEPSIDLRLKEGEKLHLSFDGLSIAQPPLTHSAHIHTHAIRRSSATAGDPVIMLTPPRAKSSSISSDTHTCADTHMRTHTHTDGQAGAGGGSGEEVLGHTDVCVEDGARGAVVDEHGTASGTHTPAQQHTDAHNAHECASDTHTQLEPSREDSDEWGDFTTA